MQRYFYLAASLPELNLEKKPSISFSDFLLDANIYLSDEDKKYVSILRELIDIENIRRLLLEQSIDDRGNLSEKALDEALLAKVNLPDYAVDFLSEYTTTQSRLDHFAALYTAFFNARKNVGNKFIDTYLAFEHQMRLWISLIRAKRLGMDFNAVLQFEDPSDPMIMGMLVQNHNSDLIIPPEFSKLKDIFSSSGQDPILLHKKIEEFRLSKITELVQDELFVVDVILGFMMKLLIIEQWYSLNYDTGLNRLNRFSQKH